MTKKTRMFTGLVHCWNVTKSRYKIKDKRMANELSKQTKLDLRYLRMARSQKSRNGLKLSISVVSSSMIRRTEATECRIG